MSPSFLDAISVANAAAYLPNWQLKSPATGSKNFWAGGLKLGYLIICFVAALFSSNLPVSCQFRELFKPFQCPGTFFSSISGILESNQYQLSTSRGSQKSNCFSTKLGDFGYFTAEKNPNLGNWAYDYLIKKVACRRWKSQFTAVWCPEVLATLDAVKAVKRGESALHTILLSHMEGSLKNVI